MTSKPAAPEIFQVTAIPQAYLDTILLLIGKARDFLEVSFIHYDGAEGRFTRLLPGAGAGSVALH